MRMQKDRGNIGYEPIIGLEIHVELKTKSKMFCGCSANYFGEKPNTHCCPVCLGLPGSLPVPNRKAIEWTVMVGLVLNCQIPLFAKFDRKNYFYPDLPKGYQISQYDKPFAVNGELNIKYQIANSKVTDQKSKIVRNNLRRIRIRRVHLEEDTGKMIHAAVDGQKCTLIDFNRSGVPLLEIVTEPDIRSGEEAVLFLRKLQQILRYSSVSECDMEKGSMRLEPNISVRPLTSERSSGATSEVAGTDSSEVNSLPDYKVEIKNLNSFKFVKKAIDYEIKRQIEILKEGKKVIQETRGWDEKREVTFTQRSKEEASDYRYFPEPDIPPIRLRKEEIEKLRNLLPELPDDKLNRFVKKYGLSEYDAGILTSQREVADYYEGAVRAAHGIDNQGITISNKAIANWIVNKRVNIDKVLPAKLVKIILKKLAPSIIEKEELEKIIQQVLLDNQKAVSDYKKGKTQALMFLVGQIMNKTKGQANSRMVAELLNEKIKMQNDNR